MNIGDIVRRNSIARPQTTAFFCESRNWNWLTVYERCARLAGALGQLEQGERVVLLARSCHRYWEAQFACALAGLVNIPLNYRLSVSDVLAIVEDVQPKALIVDLGLDLLRDDHHLTELYPFDLVIGWGGLQDGVTPYEAALESPFGERNPVRLNVVGFTSGTTGRTKGAMISHSTSVATAMWFATLFGLSERSVFLATMPPYVFRASGGAMAAPLVGAATIPKDFDAGNVLRVISDSQVTHTILAPAMLDRILGHTDFDSTDMSSLEAVFLGGAPSDAGKVELLAQRLDAHRRGVTLGCLYGMTEAIGIASMRWPLDDSPASARLRRSVGRPSPLVDVRLVGESGVPVVPGQPGEILVRGDSVMDGYWGEEVDTGLDDGWFSTGDIAIAEPSGHLMLVDRRHDIIISGGLNVYSIEVEHALLNHEGISEAAVVGAPDPAWGEAVCAFVVLTDASLTPELLESYMAQQLSKFKCPKRYYFVNSLPANAMGKIDKKALRHQLWGSTRMISGSAATSG